MGRVEEPLAIQRIGRWRDSTLWKLVVVLVLSTLSSGAGAQNGDGWSRRALHFAKAFKS